MYPILKESALRYVNHEPLVGLQGRAFFSPPAQHSRKARAFGLQGSCSTALIPDVLDAVISIFGDAGERESCFGVARPCTPHDAALCQTLTPQYTRLERLHASENLGRWCGFCPEGCRDTNCMEPFSTCHQTLKFSPLLLLDLNSLLPASTAPGATVSVIFAPISHARGRP